VFHLKPLSPDAVPAAVGKAERYRLLNEPSQAESICLDILAVDADHQPAIVMLILALTDQFRQRPGAYREALDLVPRLASAYERAYYSGLICERRAIAQVEQGGSGAAVAAREWLHDALEHYAEAEPLRAAGNDDAILRWNACVRLLARLPAHEPSSDRSVLMLE
jgi:hypothetical protein